MTIIEAAIQYIQTLFADNAGGHGADHTMRVYRSAMMIAGREPGCDPEITALAALLHDADDHKLFRTVDNANTRAFLAEQNVSPERTEKICAAINSVSFSRNRGKKPGTIEGKIVQDADRLDAIGAVGIARTFAYGGEHGRPMEASVRHFDEKLLLLKDEMNTEEAVKIAEKRHSFMADFLTQLHEETGL